MKEIKLSSGAVLKIYDVPFSEAKSLYQALLREMKMIHFDSKTDFAAVMKDMFCAGFSSIEVEKALNVCLARCLYNDSKIEDKTFDDMSAREDYLKICIDVMEECVRPFMKGLSVELKRLSGMIPGVQI